jgi:hypothetical protein
LTLEDGEHFDLLFDFIETSQSLKRFRLRWISNVSIVNRFLSVAARNSSIKEIILENITIPEDSLKNLLLCYTQSVKALTMDKASIVESNGVSPRQVAVALSQNKSIEEFDLCRMEDLFFIPLLNQLGLNTNMKRLHIGGRL